MNWLTSDVRSVNSQQLTKISLENILTQSIIREVPRMFCRVQQNDNQAKHMKNHIDLSSEDSKQLCKDIKSALDSKFSLWR